MVLIWKVIITYYPTSMLDIVIGLSSVSCAIWMKSVFSAIVAFAIVKQFFGANVYSVEISISKQAAKCIRMCISHIFELKTWFRIFGQ